MWPAVSFRIVGKRDGNCILHFPPPNFDFPKVASRFGKHRRFIERTAIVLMPSVLLVGLGLQDLPANDSFTEAHCITRVAKTKTGI